MDIQADLIKTCLAVEEQAKWGFDPGYIFNRISEGEPQWDDQKLIKKFVSNKDSIVFDMNTGEKGALLNKEVRQIDPFDVENNKHLIWHTTYFGVPLEPVVLDKANRNELLRKIYAEMESFDVVLNKDIEIAPEKIFEIIKPGGVYIVQQKGDRHLKEIALSLTGESWEGKKYTLEGYVKAHEAVGFETLYKKESFPKIKFFDIEALVYYAKTIADAVPPFNIEKNAEQLVNTYVEFQQYGSFKDEKHLMMMVFRKR